MDDQDKGYGQFGTYPKEWKRGDQTKYTVHVIYHRDRFHGPEPIPCNSCKQVILEHQEEVQKRIDDNQWVFVQHVNHTQMYGATDFYEALKDIEVLQKDVHEEG